MNILTIIFFASFLTSPVDDNYISHYEHDFEFIEKLRICWEATPVQEIDLDTIIEVDED